jgi:predicted MFS family arabinose efflux permease
MLKQVFSESHMNSQRKAWAVMLAAYLASIAIALNQSKVPPVMQVLMRDLNIDTATGGWLMSAFAVAGSMPLVASLVIGVAAAVWLSIRQTRTQAAEIEMPAA